MSSKYAILSIYRVTSNFTFHQNVDVYNIVFDCDWLAISLFLWVYDRKTSWQNSKDLMGERRCGWKTHIAKKERLIIWCLAERHNTELRKGITLPSKKWMHHLLKDILPNSIFDERRQLRFNTWNKNNTETYNLVRIEKLCSSAKSERHGEYNIVKWWKTILL